MAEKQKARNDAFASRVEAGDGTPLEEKKLRLSILTEEIRREKAESRLEKQREKVRKQQEKEEKAARGKKRLCWSRRSAFEAPPFNIAAGRASNTGSMEHRR